MIKRMCAEPNCACAAVDGRKRCAEHLASASARHTLFEGTRRVKSEGYRKLYNTGRWRQMRLVHLAENPCCALCGAIANTVDHITPHRGDEALFFNEDNLQSLCKSCHTKKTLAENNWFKKSS